MNTLLLITMGLLSRNLYKPHYFKKANYIMKSDSLSDNNEFEVRILKEKEIRIITKKWINHMVDNKKYYPQYLYYDIYALLNNIQTRGPTDHLFGYCYVDRYEPIFIIYSHLDVRKKEIRLKNIAQRPTTNYGISISGLKQKLLDVCKETNTTLNYDNLKKPELFRYWLDFSNN